jgi:hypothetical protein
MYKLAITMKTAKALRITVPPSQLVTEPSLGAPL